MGNGLTFIHYTQELADKKYDPLSIAEERKLLADYGAGSQEAFCRLVQSHLRFTIYLLRSFKIPPDMDIMDVIQEANVGLMEGLKRFKPQEYNVRVYTYCVHWMNFYIRKALSSHTKVHNIFVPQPAGDAAEEYVGEEDATQVPGYYEQIASDIVEHALKGLRSREKAILVLFFGLAPPYTPKTLQEIGSMMHMHVERVRQLKEASLEKLKKRELQALL